MTAIPADVARVLQSVRRCKACERLVRDTDRDLCAECETRKGYNMPLKVHRPRLRPRGLGEY